MLSELSQVVPYEKSGNVDAGHYLLVIRLAKKRTIGVGALGRAVFRAGWYIYVGRAKRNLRHRIERHRRRKKTLRWHIDYLLRHAKVEEVLILPLEGRDECSIAKVLERETGSVVEPRRFGSSDCGCGGHLVYVGVDCRPLPARTGDVPGA